MPSQDAASQSPTDAPLRAQDLLEVLWKVSAGALIVCYVLGFVVVHSQLREYGFFSLGLLRAQYLLAGLWALLPIGVSWVVVDYIYLQNEYGRQPPLRVPRWLRNVGGIVLAILSLIVMRHPEWFAALDVFGRVVVLSGLGLVPSAFAYFVATQIVQVVRKVGAPRLGLTLSTGAALYLVWSYTQAAGAILYTHAPASLGGGEPRLVRLAVKCEHQTALQTLGVAFEDPCVTSHVRLLFATEDEYIIIDAKSDLATTIARDLVEAVAYLRLPEPAPREAPN